MTSLSKGFQQPGNEAKSSKYACIYSSLLHCMFNAEVHTVILAHPGSASAHVYVISGSGGGGGGGGGGGSGVHNCSVVLGVLRTVIFCMNSQKAAVRCSPLSSGIPKYCNVAMSSVCICDTITSRELILMNACRPLPTVSLVPRPHTGKKKYTFPPRMWPTLVCILDNNQGITKG